MYMPISTMMTVATCCNNVAALTPSPEMKARALAVGGAFADMRAVARAQPPVGADGLDGLQAVDGFDQQAVFGFARVHGFADHHAQRPLQQHAEPGDDQHQTEQHEGNRPAEQEDDDKEEQRERQIDQRGHGSGGQEIPHRIEFAQHVGERAAGDRLAGKLHIQQLVVDAPRDDDIYAPPGNVDEIGAQRAHDEIEDEDGQRAESHHPAGLGRVARNDAVIDIQDVAGAGQAEDVDQERGQNDFAVQADILQHRAPEPVPRGVFRVRRIGIGEFGTRVNENGVTGVQALEFGARDVTARAVLRPDHFRRLAGHRQQDAGLVVLQDQNGGHDGRRDVAGVGALDDFRFQAEAFSRLDEQHGAHAFFVIGQPGADCLRRFGAAVMRGEDDKTFKQRIRTGRLCFRRRIFFFSLHAPVQRSARAPARA